MKWEGDTLHEECGEAKGGHYDMMKIKLDVCLEK